MTASTRSRLLLCLVVGLIALPAEMLLLPVARTPNPIAAAVEWTASLDSAELRDAAANIEAYPPVYRKAIMGALTPDDRSSAWRQFFQNYLEANRSLTADQIAVVREAMDVASPAAFGPGISAETKQRITEVFTRAEKVLGGHGEGVFVTPDPNSHESERAAFPQQSLTTCARGASWLIKTSIATATSKRHIRSMPNTKRLLRSSTCDSTSHSRCAARSGHGRTGWQGHPLPRVNTHTNDRALNRLSVAAASLA